jgi:hypothetical protein
MIIVNGELDRKLKESNVAYFSRNSLSVCPGGLRKIVTKLSEDTLN